jgi:hypothetical protein
MVSDGKGLPPHFCQKAAELVATTGDSISHDLRITQQRFGRGMPSTAVGHLTRPCKKSPAVSPALKALAMRSSGEADCRPEPAGEVAHRSRQAAACGVRCWAGAPVALA